MGNLAALSPDDIALLFEPNPYSYDSTVTDPSLPLSAFVQAMREQEDLFFAAFPEAKKAAEYREHRKAQLRAFLASTDADFQTTRVATPHAYGHSPHLPTPLNHHTHEIHIHDPPVVPSVYPQTPDNPLDSPHLLRIEQEEVKPEPEDMYLPTPHQQSSDHDRHSDNGDHHSGSQHIDTHKPTSTISRDRGDRVDQPSKPAPKSSSCTARPRLNKNKPTPKRPPVKRPQPQQFDPRKPTLACLFCRGRKIACGAPLPGSIGKTCNQCQRRSLPCEFPAESRRGMRRRKGDEVHGESILSP